MVKSEEYQSNLEAFYGVSNKFGGILKRLQKKSFTRVLKSWKVVKSFEEVGEKA